MQHYETSLEKLDLKTISQENIPDNILNQKINFNQNLKRQFSNKLQPIANVVSFLYNDKQWNVHDPYMQSKLKAALKKYYRRYYDYWRDLQTLMAFFAIASIVIACLDYEVNYYLEESQKFYWLVCLITTLMIVCLISSSYL